MNTTDMLQETVAIQIESVIQAEDGSEAKSIETHALKELGELYLAAKNTDSQMRIAEAEAIRQEAESKFNRRKELVSMVTDGARVVTFAGALVTMMALGYKFEESGAFTSSTFKRVQDYLWKFIRL